MSTTCQTKDNPDPAYIEMDIHGDDNEYFRTQSGTMTITEINANSFKATFSVVMVGYYNEATVNLSGTINK